MDINLSAVIEGTYLGIESMREHGQGGCIVNTASLGGIIPQVSLCLGGVLRTIIVVLMALHMSLHDSDSAPCTVQARRA